MIRNKISRSLAVVLAIAIIITCIPLNAISANRDTIDKTTDINEKSSNEPYIVSEITDKREEDTKHFLLSDGSFMAAKYNEPIHYMNDGKWENIDNSFSNSLDENNNEVFENKANSFNTKFAKKSKSKKLVTLKKGSYKIEWALQEAQKVKATASYSDIESSGDLSSLKNINGVVTYKDILNHTDLRYTVKADRIKEDIILKSNKANKSYTFNYDIKGLSYRIATDGSIAIYNPDDSECTVFVIERPYMYDAGKNYSDKVHMTVNETKKGIQVTISPDEEWLMSEDRIWPVTIDPTILTSQKATNIWDIDMRNTQSSAFNYKAEDLLVGSDSGTLYRSMVRFCDLPTIGLENTLVKAVMQITAYQGPSREGAPSLRARPSGSINVDLHRITSDWPEQGAVWNTNANSYYPETEDYFTYNSNSDSFSFDVTETVAAWYSGEYPNYGFMIKSHNESASGQVMQFTSSDWGINDTASATWRPLLYVLYRNAMGTEDYWSFTVQDCGKAGTGYVNNYNGNMVFVHTDTANNTIMNSFNISHVYNFWDVVAKPVSFGNRWRLNLMQYLEPISMQSSPDLKYVYTDGDGTKHYFIQTDNGIKDEDGLGYTLTEINETADVHGTPLKFQINAKDGTILKFDVWNCLRKIYDSNGNCINLNYSPGSTAEGNYLTSILTSTGEVFTLDYDSNYRLTGIRDKANRVTNYGYDSEGNLTSITYPDGTVTSYLYYSGMLHGVTDSNGSGFNYNYDGNGHVIRVAVKDSNNVEGNVISFKYKYNQTTITDSQNRSCTYQFDTIGRPICIYDNEQNIYSQRYTNSSSLSSEIFKNNKITIASNSVVYRNNFLSNGVFANGLDGWTSNAPSAELSLVTDCGYISSKTVKINNTQNGNSIITQTALAVSVASQYTLSGYMKTENIVSQDGGAGLEVVTSQGNVYRSDMLKNTTDADISEGFKRVTLTFSLSQGETLSSVSAGLFDATGTVWIDSLQLESGDTANQINLLSNSGMEYTPAVGNVPDGYVLSAASGVFDTADKKDGEKSFGFEGDPSCAANLRQEINISGKKGDIFSFGAWGKANSVAKHGDNNPFAVVCEFTYSDGSVGKETAEYNICVNDWQFVSRNIIADKPYIKLTLKLCYDYNCNSVRFDNAFIYRDTAQSFRYDQNGNVISTADYASQRSSFEYQNANMSKLVSPDGSDFEYSYGCAGKNNLIMAKSSNGIGYRFGYENIFSGTTSPVVSQINSDKYSETVTVGKCYYIRNRLTGKNIQPYNCGSSQGTNIVQYQPNVGTFQKWRIEDAGGGYVYLDLSDASGYRLGVKNSIASVNQHLELTNSLGDEAKFKIVFESDGGFYSIRSKLDENMTVCSDLGSTADNNQILIYPFQNAGHDRGWIFTALEKGEYTSPQADSTYYISNFSSYQCFDIPAFRVYDGCVLTQYRYIGGMNQQFKLEPCGDYYMLVPQHAEGMALSVTDSNNQPVIIRAKNNSDTHQHFSVTALSNGTYRISPRNYPEKAIAQPNSDIVASGHIICTDYTGKNWQQWRFEKVKDFTVSDAPEDGEIYYIRFNHNYQYFDIPDMGTADGTVLTQHPFNSGVNQQFKLIAASDGYFNVAAMHSTEEILLTFVPDPASTNGSGGIRLYRRNNSAYQEFKFIQTTNNTYRMVCRASASDNFCVEIPNGINTFSAAAGYVPFVGNGANWQWLTLEKAGPVIRTTAGYTDNGNYLTSITDSRGNNVNYQYDVSRDLLTATTDARGNTTSYNYNPLNDRINSVSNGDSTVSYTYNSNGRLSNITSASGTDYSFIYDAAGRTTEIKAGNRILSQTNYKDSYSSLVSQMNYGNGNIKNYTYDNLDRIISAAVNGTQTVSYTYDKSNRVSCMHDYAANITASYEYDLIGRILGIYYSNGSSAGYAYDNFNRLSKAKINLPGIGLKTEYLYGNNNPSGKRTDLIYGISLNDLEKLTYTYDRFNRSDRRIINTETPFVTQYGYLEGYDSSTTTTLIKTVKNGDDTLEYAYDEAGNIISIKLNGTVTESYTYDNLNQLTSAAYGGHTYVYTYDNGGNILSVSKDGTTVKSYTYGDTTWKDLLTNYNGEAITYDEIGNPLTYRNGYNFSWSNGRQLTGITKGTDIISYLYNAEGQRVQKTVNSVTTDYYYINGVLQAQKTGDEYIVFMYDENGTAYGMLIKNGASEAYYYYIFNAQGDVIGIVDSNGTQVVSYEYGAWGDITAITGSLAETIGEKNPIRYRGYYYDDETGFYLTGTRYYDPEIGRFINADGYVSTGQGVLGNNMFAYCLNNPVNMSDPTGEFAISATLGGIALWKIGVAIVGLVGTFILADTIAKNPPDFPSISLPKIESKPKSDSKEKDIAPAIPKDPPKKETVIYRYGGTNPGNLTPKEKDKGSGLSFSTVPMPGAAVTTIEALNATGVVYAVQDGPTHVSVRPVGATMEDWINAGSSSVWTQAVKSVVVKWDGGN